ncbi:hypothetical protein Nepgr_012693 [Nepenthes gracilis]|uniref:Serine-rich protein-like protein n=1 Tax=Nepenthes gracilis TaxID=150966 RepID=A0AAD3SGJ3_NEPGR|nr:hypothetical protein Nepgr_012693 [Nepenthes gracilis]
MAPSSKSRSSAPVLPINFSSFQRSLSPTSRFSSPPPDLLSPLSSAATPSSFAASSSSFTSSSSSTSIFRRPLSPTRVNLFNTSPQTPSVRISLNRSQSPSRSVSVRDQVVAKNSTITKKTCMCSPTTHPGSFRCSYHRNLDGNNNSNRNNNQFVCSPSRLNLRRSAMTNSLVRIGTVEGDWVKRALTALIRPSSHQQRRRADFQPQPSRLSIMSRAGDDDV